MQFAKTQQASFKNVKKKEKTHLGCSHYYSQNQSAVEANGSLASLPQTDVAQGAAETPEQKD